MGRGMTAAGPALCLHKRSGQGYAKFNGKQIWFGPFAEARTRAEFHRFKAEWESNRRKLPRPDGAGAGVITVADLIEQYLMFADGYYRHRDRTPTGHAATIRRAVAPLRELYGHTPAKDFGPPGLRTVRDSLIRRGLTRAGINQQVGILQRMFQWAHAERDILPAAAAWSLRAVTPLKAGRSEARETEPVRPAQLDHVLAILPLVSRQIRAMVLLQLVTGMRPGEVVQMRRCDLDLNGPVRQGEQFWVYRPAQHKNLHRGKKLEIAIPAQLQPILRSFFRGDPQAFLFSPVQALEEQGRRRRQARTTPMTPSQGARQRKANPKRGPGASYTVGSYRVAIGRACDRAGVPYWHPHQLRHLVSTEVVNQHGLEAGMATLHHDSAQSTQRYTVLDGGKALAIVAERARALLPGDAAAGQPVDRAG